MKNLILILISFTITSCFFEVSKESKFSSREICNCFEKQEIQNIDQRLNLCLEPINNFISELSNSNFEQSKVEELGKKGVMEVVNFLSKNCNSYRNMFITMTKKKFIFENKEKAKQIIGNSKIESIKTDTIELAKSYLSVGRIEESIQTLEIFIKKHPKADFAYWMKSYCHNQLDQVNEAVNSIDQGVKSSHNDQMIELLKIYRNLVSPINQINDEEIVLTISKEKEL